jgi:flagellar biosynthesis anti-sigma factor FlgM
MTIIERSRSNRMTDAYENTLQYTPPPPASGAPGPRDSIANGVAPASPNNEAQSGAIISLSPEALLFTRALAAARASPDVRADRVAALRARYANGDTDIDMNALAAKLLQHEE